MAHVGPWLDATAAPFGARGNARGNAQPAIQAALDKAAEADDTGARGGVVFLPPGTYRIRESLRIGSGVRLRGAAPGATTLLADFDGPAIRAADVAGAHVWAGVEGLRLNGVSATRQDSIGIDATGWNRGTLRDLDIDRFGIGILLDADRGARQGAYNTLIDHCQVSGRGARMRDIGIALRGEANENTISACRVISCAVAVEVDDPTNTHIIATEIVEFHGVGLDVAPRTVTQGVTVLGGRFETTVEDSTAVRVGALGSQVALVYPTIIGPRTHLDDSGADVSWLSHTRAKRLEVAEEVAIAPAGSYAKSVAFRAAGDRRIALLNRKGGGHADLEARRLRLTNHPMMDMDLLNGDAGPPEGSGGRLFFANNNGKAELRVRFPTGQSVVLAREGEIS